MARGIGRKHHGGNSNQKFQHTFFKKQTYRGNDDRSARFFAQKFEESQPQRVSTATDYKTSDLLLQVTCLLAKHPHVALMVMQAMATQSTALASASNPSCNF